MEIGGLAEHHFLVPSVEHFCIKIRYCSRFLKSFLLWTEVTVSLNYQYNTAALQVFKICPVHISTLSHHVFGARLIKF